MDGIGAYAHPGFAPYLEFLEGGVLPDLPALVELARVRGPCDTNVRRISFATGVCGSALAYENAIARDSVIPLRQGSDHDVFNALAWLAFPGAKAALNAVHVRDQSSAAGNRRSRARDAATLLDESGLLLGCVEPLFARLLRERAWRELFVERRAEAGRVLRPLAIGHGLLGKLRAPYRALTAHALIVAVDADVLAGTDEERARIDVAAARAIMAPDFIPLQLAPLPVAALPGWDSEELGENLFDDVSVFRPARAAQVTT